MQNRLSMWFAGFLRTVRRILLALIVLLLLAVGYAVFANSGRQFVAGILKRTDVKKVSLVCPLKTGVEPDEVAICQDCMYYPLDKTHSLPASYQPTVVPTGLAGGGSVLPIVKNNLSALFDEATLHGLSPVVTSSYRSYTEQSYTFSMWMINEWQRTGNFGQALWNAGQYSALPGHSEHQLGTAMDLNCKGCFPFDRQDVRNIALWKFLAENAHRFGFVISYPRDGEARTGYVDEPWHIRYVGVEYATMLFEQGYTQGNGVCLLSLLDTEKRY
ncbi:MAG: M15 family metallopeptidase [Chloroflexota bacterium]